MPENPKSKKTSRKEASDKLSKAMFLLSNSTKEIKKTVADRTSRDSIQKSKLDSMIKATPGYNFRKKGGVVKSKKK
jgi:hypothetical protein